MSSKKTASSIRAKKHAHNSITDADFKQWKRSCDGTKNALISDAYATIQLFKVNFVWEMKEMQMPKEFKFYTVQELLSFLKSREFEAVQAQYLPQKESAKLQDESP